MKAFKPDGTIWWSDSPADLMDRWLADPQLIDWMARTVELCELASVERDFLRYVTRPVLLVGPPSVREQRTEQAHDLLLRDCLDLAIASLAKGVLDAGL